MPVQGGSRLVCRQPFREANKHAAALVGRVFIPDGKMARSKAQRCTTAGESLFLCRSVTGPGLTMATPQTGKVYLVGAGPGDPGLLTLRAVECLQEADVVIYDQLVSERLLDWAPQAEKHCVREWGETHEQRAPRVSAMLVDYARRGKTVVRLKGGDPLIFGRGGEEFLALAEAGIPFEIVPGISAAQGAAAYTGIPLTHRSLSSAVAFITGHQAEDSPELDWASLARFPGTLAIYMGFERLGYIAEQLIRHGLPADTPAITVQWATTGKQRSAAAPLGQLAEAVRQAGSGCPGNYFDWLGRGIAKNPLVVGTATAPGPTHLTDSAPHPGTDSGSPAGTARRGSGCLSAAGNRPAAATG
jgi:uroporphyrin-III C-methyltransferase